MSMIKWEPFSHMDKWFDDDLFAKLPRAIAGGDGAIDVYEDGSNIVAEMNLPGFDPKEIDINIDEDILRIKGNREEASENKDKNFYSKEIKRGSFERALKLPHPVDASQTSASSKDGVLKITMPKKNIEASGGVSIKVE